MNKQFEVTVNPFKRSVHIGRIKEGQELEIDPAKRRNGNVLYDFVEELYFRDLDEWQSFEMDGKYYDVHFLYEDDFSLNIYEVKFKGGSAGWADYRECLVYVLDVIFFMGDDNCVSGRFAQ
jgi:hypothetical protein